MKKLLFPFLFGCTQLTSQNINEAAHHGIDKVSNIVTVHSKSYYFETNDISCCARRLMYTGIDSQGQTLFATTLSVTPGSWHLPLKLIKTLDNCLLISGYTWQSCHVAIKRDYIAKLDTLGNKLFEAILPSSGSVVSPLIVDVTQHSDSSYYIVSDTKLYHYSKNGQPLSIVNAGMTGINCIATLVNGNLLINGKIGNVFKNVEISTAAAIINQQNSSTSITKLIQAPGGEIFALTSTGTIERYSGSLSLLSSAGSDVTDFILRSDSVFVTGYSTGTQTPFYGIFGSTLSSLYFTQASYKNVVPKGISINRNKINIITSGTSATGQALTFKGLYLMPLNGNYVSTSDIGVSRMSINSYTSFVSSPPTGAALVYPSSDMNVTVKNYGNNAVNGFCLNSYISSFDCHRFFHKAYSDVIPPHDSVVVQTGNISWNTFTAPLGVQASDVFTINTCFFTTVPNASNDIEIGNDEGCGVFSIHAITGIEEYSRQLVNVQVAPNPFENILNLVCDEEIKQAEIYNTLGALQKQVQVNSPKGSINSDGLPAGIYFLKLYTEKGMAIKKVVKQ